MGRVDFDTARHTYDPNDKTLARYRNPHKHPDALVVANAGFNDLTHYREAFIGSSTEVRAPSENARRPHILPQGGIDNSPTEYEHKFVEKEPSDGRVRPVWYNWDEQRSPFGLPIRGERDVLEGEVRALQDRVRELQEETGGHRGYSGDQGYQGRHSVDGQRQWSSPALEQQWDRGSSSRGRSTSYGRLESRENSSRQGYLEEAEWGRTLPAREPEPSVREEGGNREVARGQYRGVHRVATDITADIHSGRISPLPAVWKPIR